MRTLLRALFVAATLPAVALAGIVPAASAAPRADHSASVLPGDPKVAGYIGFCDSAGHNVVGGDINAAPFAWKAVSSVAPPAAYQGAGQNAVLNVYQPRPDTRPGDWSGQSLTGASFYANKRKPAVQATYADRSLASFTAGFPAKVDGLYVLRIFWGKRNYGLYNASYPATTIQVQGSRWHVVSGGTVDCSAATKATSIEQLTGVATKQDVTPRAPATGQVTAPAGAQRRITYSPTSSSPAAAGSATASRLADDAPSEQPAAAPAASTSSSGWVLWSLVAVVAVLALLLGLSARSRRTSPAASSPPTDDMKD